MLTRASLPFLSALSLGVATLMASAVLVGDFGAASASFSGQNGKIAFEYAVR